VLSGRISFARATLEAFRRGRSSVSRRRERAMLDELASQTARLRSEFLSMSSSDLLKHFRERETPAFFLGFEASDFHASRQRDLFPEETERLIESAWLITNKHRWPLLGFGEKEFGNPLNWHRDPLSGRTWPLDYHADVPLWHNDGSDIRVLWELNRLGHLITLGRAYALTKNEEFSEEFFAQLESWREQNPVGRGANWSCAMEVALRAMNLLGAFELFLRAPQMNEVELADLLRMFDQHGAHIRRNLEYSHIATSNHYLADVTGLLWLGILLPELAAAREWREFGLQQLLAEMDKQLLADGADYEASTGYHRLKLELWLYSFVLCHINAIDIEQRYWDKLHGMIEYVRAYLRPDGRAPLLGDSDSGQVFPLVHRAGDDHEYVLALGATIFHEPHFKIEDAGPSEELLWTLGAQGLTDYEALPAGEPVSSQAFPDAGTYILRQDDLYLLFNASGSGVNGRGSHGHNDALSIEVSACGSAFVVDPGAYVYTADLRERQRFRSTAYHSTVEVDEVEQNTTDERAPFVIGDEAHPQVISWQSDSEADVVIAEHAGYQRLPQPVTHRRTVQLDKQKRFWRVEDTLSGEGTHDLAFRFHFGPGLEISVRPDGTIDVCDKMTFARLLIKANGPSAEPVLESRFSSRDYGAKEQSVSVCWTINAALPFAAQFVLIPIRADEDGSARLRLGRLTDLGNANHVG